MSNSRSPDARAPFASERRSSPRRAAFDTSLVECRTHLAGALLADGDHLVAATDGIRRAVLRLARDAATQRVPPERVLAAFKQMVKDLPDVASRPAGVRGLVARELTHVLIDAYYRPDGDGNALLPDDGPSF